MLSLKSRPFLQQFSDMHAPLQPHAVMEMSLFLSIFVSLPFSLFDSMESTSYVFSFRIVFFYLVTTRWIFYISLCKNSIINHDLTRMENTFEKTKVNCLQYYGKGTLNLLFKWCNQRCYAGVQYCKKRA